MKCRTAYLLALAGLSLCFTASGATRYDGDGDLEARLEVQRWLINRGRYDPEADADRMGLVNPLDRDFDVCEDNLGLNDFGAGPDQWEAYVVSRRPVAASAELSVAADKHCRDMGETGIFQHPSPSTNYYLANTQPKARHSAEGYPTDISGSMENLASRGRGTTGGYPSYGGTSPQFYSDLFVDAGVSSRGHRKAILNADAREIGLGWSRINYQSAGFDWTKDYTTQDYGRLIGDHFFTGTLFEDANGNGIYDEGEGVSGIDVRLFQGGVEAAHYDVSGTAGGFAVPIDDLLDGETVEVRLYNPTASDVDLSVPLGYTTTGALVLGAGESREFATFEQPDTDVNVGLRNLEPIVDSEISFWEGSMQVSFNALPGVTYVLEALDASMSTAWQELDVIVADAEEEVCVDTLVAPHRMYRVRLITD